MTSKRILGFLLVAAALGAAGWRWGPHWLQRLHPAPAEPAGQVLMCKEHGVPEAECTICHPELAGKAASGVCETEKVKIRFASPGVAGDVGIETTEVKPQPLEETVTANGRVAFDATRTARLSPRIPGVIREIKRGLGEDVEAGEILFVVDSMEMGEAQSAFLQAEVAAELASRNASREKALSERSATSQRELLAAEAEQQSSQAALSRAADRLRNLGLSQEEVDRLRKERKVSSFLPGTAPFPGTVVEHSGTLGELADPSHPILTVTDLSRVWVILDLFEQSIGKVAVGQEAVFTADAYPDRSFKGTLAWISAQMDPETRTVPARMEVKNAKRMLKANLFGKVAVTVRTEEAALAVPKAAVQWEGCHNVVFVPVGPGLYQTRKVELGCERGSDYEVVAGLLPGERVVTTGSFLMKTEILKTSIGAG